jgi:hypothetical protein
VWAPVPLRSDNERRSAQWLDDVARDSGLSDEVRRRLYDLVMVTRHNGAPTSADEAVLVDTDLAILGASAERFDEYDRQVRREYRYVPLFVTAEGGARFWWASWHAVESIRPQRTSMHLNSRHAQILDAPSTASTEVRTQVGRGPPLPAVYH